MIDREGFEELQNRWVRGEALSAEEDEARRAYALSDAVAERELSIFRELRARAHTAERDEPNVAAALARLRGVPLRVVTPREAAKKRPVQRRKSVGAAVALLVLVGTAAAAVLVTRGEDSPKAPKPRSAAPSTTGAAPAPTPTPSTLARTELLFASGDVTLGAERALVGGATMSEKDTLVTREGRACLRIDPGVDVCLARDTEITLDALSSAAVQVRVTRGAAIASLSPREAGHTFALVSGNVTATARGTVFAVEASPEGAVRVTVLEGSVAVARPGAGEAVVPAHSNLALPSSGPAKPAATGRGDEARLSSWLTPNALASRQSLGVLDIPAHGGSRVLIDDRGPYELPLQTFLDAGRHRIVLRAPDGTDSTILVDVEAGSTRRVRVEDARGTLEPGAPSARTLLDRARQRLGQGDAQGARAAYERLRALHPTSPEAHTVLIQLGRLELQAGAPARALALFEAYGKKGGALAPEALVGRIRALRALGRHAEEREAIASFLASYPKSFDAPALEKRLASLASR